MASILCGCKLVENSLKLSSKSKVKFLLLPIKRLYNILGIETSCDDTGVAILNEEGKILGESLYSQQSIHTNFGGIIPPVARDLHVENIKKAVDETFQRSNLDISKIDGVAVTVKPGLPLSLLVGLKCAKELSSSGKKPIIPIHHMEAHALTIRMVEKVDFPFLVLLISGGHSLIAVAQDVDEFLLLGKSFDDAPGEAFDKIARRLKLSNIELYAKLSGGRAIELAAKNGDANKFPITEPLLQNRDCNFSFAGVKNSARSCIIEEEEKYGIHGDGIIPSVNDMCASVQYAITKHIIRRLQRAMAYSVQEKLIPESNAHVVISGGVACNSFIGKAARYVCEQNNFKCHIPPPKLCTDNGVMIAWNGVEKWKLSRGIFQNTQLDEIDIEGKCPLGIDITKKVEEANLKITWIKSKELQQNLGIMNNC